MGVSISRIKCSNDPGFIPLELIMGVKLIIRLITCAEKQEEYLLLISEFTFESVNNSGLKTITLFKSVFGPNAVFKKYCT